MLTTESTRKKRRRRSRKRCVKWGRTNERESFDQNRSERSEDRHHRRWSRYAGGPQCDRSHARGAAFRFGQYQNQSGSRSFGRKTVAAEGDGPGTRRLQIIPDLARRRRGIRTQAARLLQENFEIRRAARVAKGVERAQQRRRWVAGRRMRRGR